MSKQFNTRIQHKIDTYENWSKAENFIPLLGELVIYTTNEKGEAETKIKIGDGTTNVNNLDFAAGGPASGETGTNAIQSDWAQTDNTQLDYIKNKPGDKITEEVKETLAELDVDFSGYEDIVPGLYAWGFDINENVEYNNGDKIVLKILPDNTILEANLYTDENADNAFGMDSDQTGHYATFNLNSNDILIAYGNGFAKQDKNIPYGIGINVVKKENPEDNTYSLFIVSAENNLENKFIILEMVRNNESYIKLSNNALNIDIEPKQASDNAVSSKGVYSALNNFLFENIEEIGEATLINVETRNLSANIDSYISGYVWTYDGTLFKDELNANNNIFIDLIDAEGKLIFNKEQMKYDLQQENLEFFYVNAFYDESMVNFVKINENLPAIIIFNVLGTIICMTDSTEHVNYKIKTYQGKYKKLPNQVLNFDEIPTEYSENLLTSGAIAAALKNIDIPVPFKAGDFIEIKDGIIRTTFGDKLMKEPSLLFDGKDITIEYDSEDESSIATFETTTPPPEIGTKVSIDLILSNNEIIKYDNVEVLGMSEDNWVDTLLLINSNQTLEEWNEQGHIKSNLELPGGYINWGGSLDEGYYMMIASDDDISGASFLIYEFNEENYIKLPNEALNIDEEVLENSNNLITSGAVYNALSTSGNVIPEVYNLDEVLENGQYLYVDELGLKHRLFVNRAELYDDDNNKVVYVTQSLIACASEEFGTGALFRFGIIENDGPIEWLTEEPIKTITSEQLHSSVGRTGCVLTSDTGGNWSWNKPKYVPTPKTEDIGKILTAIGTDPYEGFKWEELDKTMELPIIQDVAGFTELDKIIEDGVYKYITDNGINCILIVSNYDGTITVGGQVISGKIVTQLLIKTIGSFTGVENIGRGLVGPGVFIRIGVGNDQHGELAFEWQKSGRFENIHDLPQAPAHEGYYILNSKRDEENNELRYDWTEFNDTNLTDGIINQISTWIAGELENVANTNTTNTFTANQTINGNLTVNGNIIQEGDNYITHAEHVYTEDDYIVLRDGAQTPLTSYAGFEIKNYDGNNTTGHLVFDNQGTARVGDIGEEEPLTTRAEANEIVEGTLATWGMRNGAPMLTSGISIKILTQEEYDSIEKNNNTLYFIKEG